MELYEKLYELRRASGMSQEELAEKVYVTRQTVSNWETGKSYPDIHSLLLLSALFDVSLDQLIKGDLETMKQEVNAADVKAMNRDAIIFSILLAATIILPVPLLKWFGLYGLIPELLIWGAAMYLALRLERIKKANNVQSYREILAFSEGRKLDEIEQRSKRASGPIRSFCSSCSPPGSHCSSAWCSAGCCCKQHHKPPRRKASGGFSIFEKQVSHIEASARFLAQRRTRRHECAAG